MKRLNKEDIKNILLARHINNPYQKLQSLPRPNLFKDMDKGASRIAQAIQNNEQIMIVGDYDVDGIVSTTIMVEFFDKINYPVQYFIPNRFKHGYGLSIKVIEEIFAKDFSGVIVTVDNGISSFEAAKLCKKSGVDLIITDHHTVGEVLPEAFAIINPKQKECTFPFKNICGAQVAWYFCAAIKSQLELNIDMSTFLDLLSIAIISDIMPMNSLNYTITKRGLDKLNSDCRKSLQMVFERFSRVYIKSDDIGFLLSPLLNSAGRLDDPMIALKFLLAKESEEITFYMEKLIALNEERKRLQKNILQDALGKVDVSDEVICVWSDEWNEGVIGIIASSLVQKFKKAAIVFSTKNGIAKGSARSIGNINLYELLTFGNDLLLGYGGHKSAAGLSLEVKNLDPLKKKLSEFVAVNSEEISVNSTDILGILSLSDLDLELFELINSFEPYGLENEKPQFILQNVKVHRLSTFGKNGEFTKIIIVSEGIMKDVVLFDQLGDVCEGCTVDIIGTVSKNCFNKESKIQFLAKEINQIKEA